MAATSRAERMASEARFVFEGTVVALGRATMEQVPVSDRTAVVRVDAVIQGPVELNNFSGQEITVELASREKVEVGQQLVFFANPWLFGRSVAVQSLGHHAIGPTTRTLPRATEDAAEPLTKT